MQKKAVTKLTIIAKAKIFQAMELEEEINSIVFINPAPIITGIAIIKENCAATRRDRPNNNPALKVIPEREVPGISARD